MNIVVLYDISDNKSRRKIQKKVSEESYFYQKSVYEFETKNLKKLTNFLEKISNEKDRVHIFEYKSVVYLGKKPIKDFIT
jgi:CRISPR-associated endonuclease Cas2